MRGVPVALRFGLLAAAVLACDSSPTAPETRGVGVSFRFSSIVPADAPGSLDPGCAHHYAPLRMNLFASWDGFQGQRMSEDAAGEGRLFVAAVPVGSRHAVYVTDLALCKVEPGREPFAAQRIVANGVELTRLTTVGGRPAATFVVDRDGRVEP